MKVVTRTPTLLILHDSAMTLRVLGGVLEDSTSSEGGSTYRVSTTGIDQRNARRGRFALVAMACFCSIFLAVGLTMAVKQERRLSLFSR